jgi:hypothetical protein
MKRFMNYLREQERAHDERGGTVAPPPQIPPTTSLAFFLTSNPIV